MPRNDGRRRSGSEREDEEDEERHGWRTASCDRGVWFPVKRESRQTVLASTRAARARTGRPVPAADGIVSGRADGDRFAVPILRANPRGPATRWARLLDGRHPVLVFFTALLCGFAAVGVISIGVGYLVQHLLLPTAGIGSWDESVNVWLAAHRGSTATEASLIGSTVAGAPLLPILVAAIALVFAALRRWRLAAFVLFALAGESALYRVTTLVIHRHRPNVVRLDSLPVNASYPSGHTAASVAVYSGLALLLPSRFTRGRFRVLAWGAAVTVTLFVAGSRLYRGMHHPIDVAAGALLGMAALVVVVFACRAAGAAADARALAAGRSTP